MKLLWLVVLCLFLTACGGGSGASGSPGDDGNVLTPDPVSGTARVTVSTLGPSADSVFYAAQFTLRLPAGISVPTNAASAIVADGVLVPAVGGAYAGASVVAPAGAASGPLLLINITHPGGVTVGPLATITCTVAAGAAPAAGAFSIDAFSARDANGAVISGINPRLTLQTQ